MSNENARLDQVEIIKELKELDSKILSKFSEIEKAKTGDALTTTVEALRQMMEGQRGHQERTMAIAQQLLQSE
jgi:hypothetical protein